MCRVDCWELSNFSENVVVSIFTLTLKIVTEIFAETLGNSQHSTRDIHGSRDCRLQKPKGKIIIWLLFKWLYFSFISLQETRHSVYYNTLHECETTLGIFLMHLGTIKFRICGVFFLYLTYQPLKYHSYNLKFCFVCQSKFLTLIEQQFSTHSHTL